MYKIWKCIIDGTSELLFYLLIYTYAGISELGVRTFRAKIGTGNTPSLKLFQQKLSFVKVRGTLVTR